ncbi:MAG TPA: hypothetical protein VF837_03525 [Patescibacteria group bacterium]
MKRIFLVFALILLAFSTISCSKQYNSKADYFDGSVLVEYNTTTAQGENDNLTITFYDKGDYQVDFSYTKGYENNSWNHGKAVLPENFKYTVTDGPRTKVITEYVLPGFLTVSITHGDKTESHDFK